MDSPSRRTTLQVGGLVAAGVLAGCLRLDTSDGSTGANGDDGGSPDGAGDTGGGDDDTATADDESPGASDGTSDGTTDASSPFWESYNASDERFQDGELHLRRALQAGENGEYDRCDEEVAEMYTEFDQAREHAVEARGIAQDEGMEQHTEAMWTWLDFIDTHRSLGAEIEAMCAAGREGDSEEVERRRDNIEELIVDIDDIRERVDEQFGALDE